MQHSIAYPQTVAQFDHALTTGERWEAAMQAAGVIPMTNWRQAYRASDGATGIAHLRANGLVAFYPAHRASAARGLNYVCQRSELILGPWCDREGRPL